MRLTTKTHVGYALTGCLIAVLIAFTLIPAGLVANDGISFYGIHWISVVPYASALALYAVALLQACKLLAAQYSTPEVEKAGWFMDFCLAALILTPYSLSVLVHAIHDTVGSGLFCTQLALAFWLVWHRRRHTLDLLLLSIQFAAGVAAFFSLFDIWRLEVSGQLVYQIVFVTIVWRSLEGSVDLARPLVKNNAAHESEIPHHDY